MRSPSGLLEHVLQLGKNYRLERIQAIPQILLSKSLRQAEAETLTRGKTPRLMSTLSAMKPY